MRTRTQVASFADAHSNEVMGKSKKTLSFRPNDWEERAVAAAEHATGRKRSELLRRCVSTALQQVVHDLLKEHDSKVAEFTTIIEQAKSAASDHSLGKRGKKVA